MVCYLSGGGVHHFLTDEVRLVPHQQPGDVFTGVTLDLLQPLPHVVEGLLSREMTHVSVLSGYKDDLTTMADLLSDVIDDDDAVSSSVVAGGDGSKPLLTRRVPLSDINTI